MPRTYTQKRRAERHEATRLRIVESTVALHEAIGGEATTINAIAERAGVSRLTVYRHFPDQHALLSACTGHYLTQNPPPNPATWMEIADPHRRIRTALSAVYAFYRQTQGMLARAEQETPTNPILAELMTPFAAFWGMIRDGLANSWDDNTPPAPVFVAAIGHALAFSTWRSLTIDQGLDDDQAIQLMVSLILTAAGQSALGTVDEVCSADNAERLAKVRA